MAEAQRAVCLLSGGLDSSTCLAIARQEGFECYCLSFDYGQRHRIELHAAAQIAEHLGAKEHRTIKIDLRAFGGSALTSEIDVPKNRSETEMAGGIPVTYVPARNTIFLSLRSCLCRGHRSFEHLHWSERARLLRLPGLPAGIHSGLRESGQSGDQGRRGRQDPACHPSSSPGHDQSRDCAQSSRTRGRSELNPQLLRSRSARSGLRPLRLLPAAAKRVRRSAIGRPGICLT